MAVQLRMTSSTGESNIDDLDMKTWLTQNRLTKLKQYFEENEVIVADLLKYQEEDIDVVLNDVNIRAGAYIKRFKDSVRELQHTYSKTNSLQNNLNQVYRIVTSMKEDECIKLLSIKHTEVDVAMQNNMNIASKLMENTKQIENDINIAFKTYKNKLDEREKLIITKLNQDTNEQLNILQKKKNNLEKYKVSIEAAQKEQNSLVLDPEIDRTKREGKIEDIKNDVVNSMNDDDMKAVVYPLAFAVDNNVINQYISSIGTITIDPDPPILSVTDIDTVTATITIEGKANDDIISYAIKYKQGDIDDDEKKMDWNDVVIDNNKYKLTKLKPNTKYIICGKYKISKDNAWSQCSKIVSFQTLQLEEKWDNNVGNGVTVNGDLATWTNAQWAWYNAFGTVYVKQGKHEWKLRFNKIGNSCITVGVVNPNNEKIQWPFKFDDNTNCNYAFGTGDGGLNKFMRAANMGAFGWKNGDFLVMVLDLKNSTMTYTINGKCATFSNKIVANTQDVVYKLVVCNIGVGTEVQLVSYRSL